MALLERIIVEPIAALRSVEEIPEGTRYVPERLLSVDEFYELIGEKSRAELDEGAIVLPSPVSLHHEDCFTFLITLLRLYVDARGLGIVLGSRFKARLGPRTAREPDILFVSTQRMHLVGGLEVNGAPDLVVEIINSDKARSEALVKLPQYRQAGTAELWLVDLPVRRVFQHILDGGQFVETVVEGGEPLRCRVIAGFHIDTSLLFSEPGQYPPAWPVLQALLAEEAR